MRILLTGGLGFIGSSILKRLNERGERQIVIVDHLATSDKWKNIVGTFYEDLFDMADLERVATSGRFDMIIHMGARTDTRERDLGLLYRMNLATSRLLFMTAVQTSARFLYASSAATYGDGSSGWSDTTAPTQLKPLNAYGFYKNVFDQWVMGQLNHPPQCLGFKFFNVYGPGEAHKGLMASAVYHFYDELIHGGRVQLFKSGRGDIADGCQRRDFIFIEDAVKLVECGIDDSRLNGLLNVGTGRAATFLDVVSALSAALGCEIKPEFIEMPLDIGGGYQYFSRAEITAGRVRNVPTMSLREGVAAYCDALTSEGGTVSRPCLGSTDREQY